ASNAPKCPPSVCALGSYNTFPGQYTLLLAPVFSHPRTTSRVTDHVDKARPTAKGKILVIEDHATQTGELLAALGRLGYATIWARSGAEGLVLAQSDSPDLAILDVVLGDMDGFAV